MNEREERRHVKRKTASFTALAMTVLGCGGAVEGPQRVAVEGEVTFRGRPVERGSILFIPTEQTRGPRTGAIIKAGQYRLSKEHGPVLGRLRVEIRTERKLDYDITEPTESVKHIGEPLPRGEIPPKYNDRSLLVVETTSEGDNTFDFHLPTKH